MLNKSLFCSEAVDHEIIFLLFSQFALNETNSTGNGEAVFKSQIKLLLFIPGPNISNLTPVAIWFTLTVSDLLLKYVNRDEVAVPFLEIPTAVPKEK